MPKDLIPRNSGFFDMSPLNFSDDFTRSFFDGFKTNLMKTDIHESELEIVVETELPGIPKENIEVHYENGILTIEGKFETDTQKTDEDATILQSERSFRNVKRQFALRDIVEEKINAKYKDGILTVTLPKSEPTQERKENIPIE